MNTSYPLTVRTFFTIVLLFLFSTPILNAEVQSPLVEHDGSRGVWLKSNTLEAFLATEPEFRVLAIRRPGTESLLANSEHPQRGIRLAFLEPIQIPDSFAVGNQSAKLLELRDGRFAKVELSSAVGLQYSATVELETDQPCVRLKFDLRNIDTRARKVAAWSLLSFSRDEPTRFIVPFGDQPRALRRTVVPWWSAWPQPSVIMSRDTLSIDAAATIIGDAMKIGVTTEAGWAALARGREILIATSPFDATATYPEGGANITCFAGKGWCEIEHVGPLAELSPGEATSLVQTIDLHSLPNDLPPKPDEARSWIQSAMNDRDAK